MIALLPDEQHLAQLGADRKWIASLLRSGPLDVKAIAHLTGMGPRRAKAALMCSVDKGPHEWFSLVGRKWLLTGEGRACL